MKKDPPGSVPTGLTLCVSGVPERIRTSDTRFRRAVLCPLSYRDKCDTVFNCVPEYDNTDDLIYQGGGEQKEVAKVNKMKETYYHIHRIIIWVTI